MEILTITSCIHSLRSRRWSDLTPLSRLSSVRGWGVPDRSAVPSTTDSPVVTWEQVDDATLVIRLERPPANALGLPLIQGLERAMDHADGLTGLKAVVVSSRVPGIFVAGADIKHMLAGDADAFSAYGAALRPQVSRFASTDRITVAAVEGLALGGGCELAMACTLRVAGGRARFGLPEVKLGLIPGAGGTQRLPHLVGRGRALDIMLSGRNVPATEAHTIGLVDRLCDDGDAERVAIELARELGSRSQPAVHAVMRCVDAAFDEPMAAGLEREVSASAELFESGEVREGLTAFVEKRAPRFA